MEFGDIIYFILLVFFMILGFFNDSRKKKKQQEQLEEETASFPQPPRSDLPKTVKTRKREERPVFQSSMEQVTDFKKYDSGDNIEFDYDADSIHDEDTESRLSPRLASYSTSSIPPRPSDPFVTVSRRTSDGKNRGGVHPLVAELNEGDGINALKKGIIYSEILQRKY